MLYRPVICEFVCKSLPYTAVQEASHVKVRCAFTCGPASPILEKVHVLQLSHGPVV